MRNCNQCGQPMDEGYSHCPMCGSPQEPVAPAQEAETPAPPEAQPAAEAADAAASLDAQAAQEEAVPTAEAPDAEPSDSTAPEEPAMAVDAVDVEEEGTEAKAAPKARYCIKCGNRLPDQGDFCGACGAPAAKIPTTEEIVPVSEPYYSREESDYPPAEAPQTKSRTPVFVAVLIIVLLLALLVGGGLALFGNGGIRTAKVPGDQPILYIKDEETLKFFNSAMDAAETITDAYDSQSEDYWTSTYALQTTSKDGKYLLYLNDFRQRDYTGRGDLYLRDLTELTTENRPSNRGIKIASDVTTEFYFSDDEQYVFYINTKGDLYVWDFTESYRLDSDVTGIADWNGKQVLYFKGASADSYTSYVSTRDYYLAAFDRNDRDGKTKIDSDINDMWDFTEDFSKFIYTKTSRKDGGVMFDIYSYDLNTAERETLLTNVDDLVDANADDGSLLYLTSRPTSFTLDDVIEDDMLEEDREIEEPKMEDYPMVDKYYNDYSWYYDMDDDFDYYEFMEQMDEWEAAQRNYSTKEQRDKLREKISDDINLHTDYDVHLYDLYYLKGGERIKVDGEIYQASFAYGSQVAGNIQQNFAYYLRLDLKGVEKLKMSEINQGLSRFTFDVGDYLKENLVGELYFTLLDGESERLTNKSDKLEASTGDVFVTENVDGVYFIVTDVGGSRYSGDAQLHYASIEDGKVGKAEKIEDSVGDFSYELYQGSYYFLANVRNGNGDLYTLQGTTRDRLFYDISADFPPYVYNDGQTICFFENYDNSREMGDLYLMHDDKVLVAEDVYDYYYRSDNMIYVLRNYRAGKGDLYLWNGQSLDLVDYDVTQVMDTRFYADIRDDMRAERYQ